MEIVHYGFATKQGSQFKTWKNRFFVLFSDSKLFYFKDDVLKDQKLTLLQIRSNALNKDHPLIVSEAKVSYSEEKRLKSKYCIQLERMTKGKMKRNEITETTKATNQQNSEEEDLDEEDFFFFLNSAISMFEWMCKLVEVGGILTTEMESTNSHFMESFGDEELFHCGITQPEDREIVLLRLAKMKESKEDVVFRKAEKQLGGILRSNKIFHFSTLIRYLADPLSLSRTYLSDTDTSQRLLMKHLLEYDEKCIITPYENKYIHIKLLLRPVSSSPLRSRREMLSPVMSSIKAFSNFKLESSTTFTPSLQLIAGVIVDQWLLEWNSSALVVPKRIYGSLEKNSNEMGMIFEDCSVNFCIMDVELKNTSKISVSKALAGVVAKWNAKMSYAENPTQKSQGNSMNFIDDVLKCLRVSEKSSKSFLAINTIFNEIREKGFIETKFYSRKDLAEKYPKLSTFNYPIVFKSEKDVDSFCKIFLDEKNSFETFQNNFPIDFFLLKSFDRIFKCIESSATYQKENDCLFGDPLTISTSYRCRYFKGSVEFLNKITPIPLKKILKN